MEACKDTPCIKTKVFYFILCNKVMEMNMDVQMLSPFTNLGI